MTKTEDEVSFDQRSAWLEPRVMYPILAGGLSLALLVATYSVMRWSPSPFEVSFFVSVPLLIALAVSAYFGAQAGHSAPFLAAAILLPFVLSAVFAYASIKRAATEIDDLFGTMGNEYSDYAAEGDGGMSTVPKVAVAQQVSDQLEARVGRAPDSVECPEGLKAEVGATLRCILTDGPMQFGVDVEVTAVDGSDVNFDIQVDDAPS